VRQFDASDPKLLREARRAGHLDLDSAVVGRIARHRLRCPFAVYVRLGCELRKSAHNFGSNCASSRKRQQARGSLVSLGGIRMAHGDVCDHAGSTCSYTPNWGKDLFEISSRQNSAIFGKSHRSTSSAFARYQVGSLSPRGGERQRHCCKPEAGNSLDAHVLVKSSVNGRGHCGSLDLGRKVCWYDSGFRASCLRMTRRCHRRLSTILAGEH
jgi:hypothetical protein